MWNDSIILWHSIADGVETIECTLTGCNNYNGSWSIRYRNEVLIAMQDDTGEFQPVLKLSEKDVERATILGDIVRTHVQSFLSK